MDESRIYQKDTVQTVVPGQAFLVDPPNTTNNKKKKQRLTWAAAPTSRSPAAPVAARVTLPVLPDVPL